MNEPNKVLHHLLYQAFTHIRYEVAIGNYEKAIKLCSFMHNVPLIMLRENADNILKERQETSKYDPEIYDWMSNTIQFIEEQRT